MSRRINGPLLAILTVAAAAAALLVQAQVSHAADSSSTKQGYHKWPGEQGDTWQSIAKLPSLQGGWVGEQGSFAHDVDTVANPHENPYSAPLLPKWESYRLSNAAANNGHGPLSGTVNNSTKCLPHGMPALMRTPAVFMILLQPGVVIILSEQGEYRRIYTDGRPHQDDPDFTWMGDSIGHWEGDTLVVDTVAIKTKAEIFMGMPHASDKTHVVERFHLDSKAHKLNLQSTVTNEDQFTHPWTYEHNFVPAPNGLVESYCTENNRDTDRGVTNLNPNSSNLNPNTSIPNPNGNSPLPSN